MTAKSYGLGVDTGEPGAKASNPVELSKVKTNIFPVARLIATTKLPRGVSITRSISASPKGEPLTSVSEFGPTL